MFSASFEWVKFQLHGRRALACRIGDLGLRDERRKCACNLFRINYMTPELELRGPEQYFAHNPEKIGSLHSEFGLRDIPGKSAQWGWQTQRLRRLLPCPALLHTPRHKSNPDSACATPLASFGGARLGNQLARKRVDVFQLAGRGDDRSSKVFSERQAWR